MVLHTTCFGFQDAIDGHLSIAEIFNKVPIREDRKKGVHRNFFEQLWFYDQVVLARRGNSVATVVDTNNLVRALIKPTGSVGPIIQRLRDNHYHLVYSKPLLSEFVDVINRPRIRDKYHFVPEDISTVVEFRSVRGRDVRPEKKSEISRDPTENVVV